MLNNGFQYALGHIETPYKTCRKWRIPGSDVQNPRALGRVAASVAMDALVQSWMRKWARVSDVNIEKTYSKIAMEELESDCDQTWNTMIEHDVRWSPERMGSGIECRTERIQLGISTKPMGINGDLHETPVQCFCDQAFCLSSAIQSPGGIQWRPWSGLRKVGC